jgi:hypothetical protein
MLCISYFGYFLCSMREVPIHSRLRYNLSVMIILRLILAELSVSLCKRFPRLNVPIDDRIDACQARHV